jgi:hypothetical protein
MTTGSNHRSPYLIPILVFFIVAVLVFIGMLVNFLSSQIPALAPTNLAQISSIATTASPSITSSSTITLTPRPTWTMRPTGTDTQTPVPTSTTTPTLIRSLTPATPAKVNVWYELKPWDLTQQEQSIQLLQARTVLSASDENFIALALVEGEALVRFPQVLDSTQWRWDRAYNLVRFNDPQGIVLYCSLLQTARLWSSPCC